MPDKSDVFDKLPLPETNPRGLFRHFGPGLILMMTGIGTSHLVTAPAAGGRFEFALLWCIPVAYIFKYYGFEMAFPLRMPPAGACSTRTRPHRENGWFGMC